MADDAGHVLNKVVGQNDVEAMIEKGPPAEHWQPPAETDSLPSEGLRLESSSGTNGQASESIIPMRRRAHAVVEFIAVAKGYARGGQDLLGRVAQHCPSRRKREWSLAAADGPRIERGSEVSDAIGDGWLRHLQPLRCGNRGACLAGKDKRVE
jgi:hypothetical protein